MFKESKTNEQKEISQDLKEHLGTKKLKKLEHPTNWCNVFYQEIVCRIDEKPFAVLYSEIGRKNAPIRQMLGMMILKEGQNWTDEQLFMNCQFNLLTMRSLGMTELMDEAPSPSTYYEFKQKLLSHYQNTGVELIKQCFDSLTHDHCELV